jgi:hypothetical protein
VFGKLVWEADCWQVEEPSGVVRSTCTLKDQAIYFSLKSFESAHEIMQNGIICLNLVEEMLAFQQSWAEPW